MGETGPSIPDALTTATLVKPESFAALAIHKRLKHKQEDLRTALRSERSDHFRFLRADQLSELDRLNDKLALLEHCLTDQMKPYEELLRQFMRDRLHPSPNVLSRSLFYDLPDILPAGIDCMVIVNCRC